MAVDDIVFSEGDSQNFIVEVPEGTLNAPVDIVFDDSEIVEIPISPPTHPEVYYVS